jgi:hypothetical protein
MLVTPAIRKAVSLIERMARLGGLGRADRIAVTGPGAVDGVGALCRLGFDEAVCLSGAGCGCVHAGAPAEGLLIPDRLSDWALAERLDAAAGWLAGEGVVVARLRDVDQDLVLQARLERAGVELRSTVFDMSRGVIVAHRVRRRPVRGRAAVPQARAA